MPALWIGAAASVAGAALKGSGGGAAPGMSSMPFSSTFDTSNWVVNTGSGSASAVQDRTSAGSPAGALMQNPLMLVALLALLYLAFKSEIH
jgi:hypothetical protein